MDKAQRTVLLINRNGSMLMEKPKLIIHIGPHKTATTFLQKYFFCRIKEFHYVGRYIYPKRNPLIYQMFMRYLTDGSERKKAWVISFFTKNQSSKFLLSEEWLSSDYTGRVYPFTAWQLKLSRLAALSEFLDIKIIYYTRPPAEAVYSLYIEFDRAGVIKGQSLIEFAGSNTAKFFNYEASHKFLVSLFGEGCVNQLSYCPGGIDLEGLSNYLGVEKPLVYTKAHSDRITEEEYIQVDAVNSCVTTAVSFLRPFLPDLFLTNHRVLKFYKYLKKRTINTKKYPKLDPEKKNIINREIE